ncbi:MAG: PP2C family protein-serine/threonine phosphatase [Phycisphaerales bacterium JB041]
MAKRSNTNAAYTTEFHHEFRAETGRLLVRRFLWFTAVVVSFGLLSMIGGMIAAMSSASVVGDGTSDPVEAFRNPLTWVFSAVWLAAFASALVYVWRKRPAESLVLRISFWVVTFDGLLNIVSLAAGVPGSMGAFGFFVTHLLACLFMPWSAWQALRPMIVVLAANALVTLLIRYPVWTGAMGVDEWARLIASPLLALPGTLWCSTRHSKRVKDFRYKFVNSKYSEMRRELVDARRIHESLFPETIEDGPVRFAFEYEPMRQIGGDFLFSHYCRGRDGEPDGPLNVVLLDVTGHGIPAALTVNRLHGELERIFAEMPDAGPGEVLRLLNRYVHLTLSTHSIYVTGMCLRVDCARGQLEYASGGHPPAFLRAVDGTIEELQSTSFVLGACPDEAFDPAPRTLEFGPGDTILAYTDGAIEARNDSGKMFRIDGIRRMVASADGRSPTLWPRIFKDEVIEFRGGPPEDDTLLLVLHHAVAGTSVRKAAPGSNAGVGATT